ncbi:ABC transporter permease [Pseudooceanicola sediminis]|uniref:ABC transporter permease n=1 Tax=Pseudooceanicola sediminis TaxID=2211117 RepID=A0A399J2M9_9RHOB|nr:ABC transporter permease [Pseudooceanicola sediminis]KAA2313892.1 ABC transporter permease [Puniceibacterium sp. HSS470]RII38709.1 ABC transporter permease [Pseudooceanicola sediminis]|tara:strand:- start:10355 stop:11248 length:894 start_codon:yes stop_codon:yes gene_type:complete
MKTPNDSPIKLLFLAPLVIWIGVMFLAPLLFLLWVGFWHIEAYRAVPGFSLTNYAEIFSSFFTGSRYGWALLQSLWVAGTTAILATAFAYATALALAFAVPPRLQRAALLFAIVPFWSSYVLRLYAWQTILSGNGVINSLLKQAGLSWKFEVIYTQIATRIGLVHYLAPILIVILYVSVLSIDRVLIEAARELGCTRWQVFTRLIFPLSRFGLLTAGSFAVIVSLGDALSGNLLGGGAGQSILGKLPTYASMIMSDYSSATNLPRTSALATILIVVMVAALVAGVALATAARRKVSQ